MQIRLFDNHFLFNPLGGVIPLDIFVNFGG